MATKPDNFGEDHTLRLADLDTDEFISANTSIEVFQPVATDEPLQSVSMRVPIDSRNEDVTKVSRLERQVHKLKQIVRKLLDIELNKQ